MQTLLVALLLSGLMLASAGVASAEATQGLVIGEEVSVYASPNANSNIVATATYGEMLQVLTEQQTWYQVRSDASATGYVLKRNLVGDPEQVTALSNGTQLYAMPNLSSKTVGELQAGEQLYVIGEFDNFWAVSLRTASAFVSKDAVDYSGVISRPTTAPTARPTATAQPVNTLYLVVRDTSLRTQPSSSAPINGTMVAGSFVYINLVQNGYGQNAENGYWLSMSDLQRADTISSWPPVVETAEPSAFRYLVIKDGTSVYAEPTTGSTVVDTLNDGDSVTVSTTQDGFGLVQYGRQRGWVEMSNLLSFHR